MHAAQSLLKLVEPLADGERSRLDEDHWVPAHCKSNCPNSTVVLASRRNETKTEANLYWPLVGALARQTTLGSLCKVAEFMPRAVDISPPLPSRSSLTGKGHS